LGKIEQFATFLRMHSNSSKHSLLFNIAVLIGYPPKEIDYKSTLDGIGKFVQKGDLLTVREKPTTSAPAQPPFRPSATAIAADFLNKAPSTLPAASSQGSSTSTAQTKKRKEQAEVTRSSSTAKTIWDLKPGKSDRDTVVSKRRKVGGDDLPDKPVKCEDCFRLAFNRANSVLLNVV
jgi:hypothetical protein